MNAVNDELIANKKLGLAFIGHCFRCEVDCAMALLAPDATWWVLGDPDKVRVAGLRHFPQIERFLVNVRKVFPHGLEATIEGVTAEGERVAIEASSVARLGDGSIYRNRYHFLVRVQAQRIIEMREYLDTQYAYEAQQASTPLDS